MSTANHIGRVAAITIGIAALLVMSGSGRRQQVSRSGAPTLTRLPLAFEPNQGQFPAEERFVSRSGAFALILTDTGAVFRLGDQAVRQNGRARLPRTEAVIPATLTFSGATARTPRGEGLLPSVANYLIGNDPSLWRTGVRQYARVRYRGIYPGIDVVYHGDEQKLEYDMIVAPNGEPNNIRLAISGGALTLESDGSLAVRSGGRTLLQDRPLAYQDLRGERRFVEAQYEIAENGREVGIRMGTYDRSAPLVIDPVLDYGVLVGGSGKEGANFLAVDSAGNAYIAGTTSSADLGLGASISGSLRGSSDAFVSKLSPTGALLFTTYLGGGGNDVATSVAVNSSGSLFICGVTDSFDYPMAGSTQFPFGGGQEDGFFSILGSSGANLIASTYYGGSGDDVANALALDVNSNAYVAGYTTSTSIPGLATSSLQATNAGGYDAFVAKFSTTGSLLFATFYGGTGDDQVYAATTDGLGDAWITGASDSSALPAGATGNHASGGAGFIFRIASSGSAWKVSQFFGGSGDQVPFGIAIDSSGLVWVAGSTNSTDYPTTAAALQKTLAGGYDAFLTAFSQSIVGATITPGLSIAYSTYVGGSGTDIGYTVATGRNQTVYVGGFTSSPNLLPAGRPQPGANKSTFLFELSFASLSTTPSIPTALYLNAQDVSNPVTVALRATSSADEVFLAGYADNTVVFPSSSQGQSPPYHGGTTDAFVAKLAHADLSISPVTTSLSLISTAVSPLAFRVLNGGPSAADNVVVQMSVPSGLIVLSCSARFLCSTSNGFVTVTYPTLAAEASDLITLQVKATSAGASGSFNAFVTSATNDSSPNNNFAAGTFNLAVGQPPFVLNPADVLTFQTQSLGQFSQQSVTLTPVSGAVDIELSLMPQPGTSAAAFGFAPGTPTKFTASQAQTIPLTFAPNQTGAAGALLMVKAPNAAYTTAVSLGGTGNAPANLPTAFLPEFTVGGGFVMGFYVLNNSANPSTFTIAFYDDGGNPVSLPFTGSSPTPTLSDTIGPNGAKYYEAGAFDGSISAGWGAITAPPSITISAILRRRGSDGSYYEAAVPATTGYNEFQIPFDATIFAANGAQIVTGFAIANLDASTPAAVTCTARDSSGNLIPGAVSVPPLSRYGHWASGDFPKLKGLRGTLDCSSNTMVGGLALRFIGTNSQSSLPVTPAGASGGAGQPAMPTAFLPEFTVGGGFVMGFYVLNNSATASTFTIAFYDDGGNPVSLPFTGSSPTPTLSDTIGPNGAKYYEAGTFDGSISAGWGAITAPPTITISAILRRRGSDGSYYEAAVPATTGYNEFQIPFDATIFPANGAQIVTGFAIANLDASTPAAVTCTARDSSGNLIPGAVSVPPLNRYGHWASGDFPALKGLRGTLDCSSNTKVGGLALRFIGTNSQSSLPVIPVR